MTQITITAAIRQASWEVDMVRSGSRSWQVRSYDASRGAWIVGPSVSYDFARHAMTTERAVRAVQALYPQEDRFDVACLVQDRAELGGTLREIVRDVVAELAGRAGRQESGRGNRMKNVSRHDGTLEIVQRLPNSHNGNPRYLLRVEGAGEFRTAVDSGLAYSIPNYVGKRVVVEIGTFTPYGDPTLRSIRLAEEGE